MVNQEQLLNEFISKLNEIIQKNLGNPAFAIDQICIEMNVSRAQLHRKVKAATGLSTSLYIRRMRMEQAKRLLSTTQLNVSQIAYQIGISSPQNFSKYFIETYGVSPSVYRKQQQNPTEEPAEPPVMTLPTPEEPTAPLPVAAPRRRSWGLIGLLLSAVVGISVVIGWYYQKERLPPVTHPKLVILPFEYKATASDSFLNTGIAEDIQLRLKQITSLSILPTPLFKASTGATNADTAVQVDYILTGEWTTRQNKPSLTVRLLRVADERQLWKKRYDSHEVHLAAIAGKVALEVANILSLPLNEALAERIQHQPTASEEAYQLVLHSRYLLKNRTQESLEESLHLFEQALRLDSVYSDAYLGKANVLNLLVNMSYSTDEKSDLKQAEQFALLAIKANTNNAQAYAVLGNIYSEQYDWQESLTAYQIALKLQPNDAFTNYWYSLALRSTGDLKQALHYHQIAYELDPTHPIIFNGYIYTAIFAKDFELAARLLKERSTDFNQSFLYWFILGSFYLAQAQYEPALTYFDKSLELNAMFKSAQSARIFCLGKMGKRHEVETFLAALDTTRADDCLAAAAAYAGLGNIEQGIYYLKAAADKGKVPEYLLVDIRYAPLRQHPTFRKIAEAYGLEPVLE